MYEMVGYEWLIYGGAAAMAVAGGLFALRLVLYLVKKSRIEREMDEEYGQPQLYNRKGG